MGTHLFRQRVFGLALVLALLASETIRDKPITLESRLIFWNIGQGDFMTLATPAGCWSFDVGGSFALPLKALVYLQDHCPRHHMEIFVSHFDKDHIRNFGRLATHLIVTDAFFSHLQPRTQFGLHLLQDLQFQKAHIHEIRAGFLTQLGPFKLRCLWPPPSVPLGKNENDRSLVLLLIGMGKKILVTGDFPGKLEHKLMVDEVDILKVAHHGSRSSTTRKFLNFLKPKDCIVSVGAHNSYGHPTPETLGRLAQSHCTILRTDRLGTIEFIL